MKKVTLNKGEFIQHKLKYGKRILLFDLFLLVLVIYVNRSSNYTMTLHLIFAISLVIFIFIPVLYHTVLNFIRVLTHRVYITNQNIYLFKGYIFKRIHIIPLQDITEVHTKESIFDKRMGLKNVKINTQQAKQYIFKGVKNADPLIALVSQSIIGRQKSQS